MISFLANTKNITFFLKLSQCFICSVLMVHIIFSNALVIYVQIGHYTDYKCTSSPRLTFIYIPEPSSVQFSHSVVSDSLRPYELQHARLPCPSPTPGAYSNPCPLSQWCYATISFSVVPFSSCLQSFPGSESIQMSQFFTSGGPSIGVSASASVLPMNIHKWFTLIDWWISLQSKRLSRVFSNTTVQKDQFFGAQLSLCSNFHIDTWLL